MTTFTNVFGNDTVPPSENSYAAYSISVSSDMVWPNSYSGTGLLVAEIIEISATAGGLSVDLPPANEMSVGAGILLRNTGANDININNADGSNLTSIAAGVVKFLYISDNSSSAGVWGIFTFGTGTSSADASTLAGFGLRVWMAKLVPNHAYIEKNGNYTVLDSDRNKLINVTAGSITITLPLASSVEAGFHVLIRNSSIGTVTVDGNGTESINNELTFELQPGESAIFVCSGSGWFTVGYGRDVEFMFSEFVINAAAGNVNLSSTDVSGRMIRVGGTAVGNIVVTLPAIDNIYFVNVESGMGAFTVTFTTGSGSTVVMLANQRTALYSDGTNITAAITTSLVSTIALDDGSAAVPTLFFVLDTNTGMFRRAEGELGITSNGVEVAYFGADGLHADGGFFGGDTAQVVSGFTSNHLQSMGAGSDVGFSASLWQNTANPPDIQFMKSRGASISTHVIVQNGDNTLSITAAGDDGVAFIQSARITASIDGVPGVNDMPGRLGFWTTPDGSSGVVERMRIDSAGLVAVTGTQTITANSSSDAFRVTQTGSGNVFVAEDSANPDGSPFLIDANGRVVIGHTAAINGAASINPALQIDSASGGGSSVCLNTFNVSSSSNPFIQMNKSANAAIGSHSIVASGDSIGTITFGGSDGVQFIRAAQIYGEIDGTPGVNDMPGRLIFATTADGASSPTERMRIDFAGRVLVGGSASITGTGGITPRIQVVGTTASDSSQSLNTFSITSTVAATFQLNKSANASVGSHTIVVDGEQVGNVYFAGSDGVAFIRTAMIRSEVDGAPGVNDMPGRLIFGTTADGGTVPTERMRITSGGFVGIGSSAPLSELHINGSDTSTDVIRITSAVGAGQQEIGIGFAPAGPTLANPSAAVRALEFDTSDARAHLLFYTRDSNADVAPTERMRIDSDGRVLVGQSAALTGTGGIIPRIQLSGTSTATSSQSLNTFSVTDTEAATFQLNKSGNAAVGSHTIVANGEQLGNIYFSGSDGAAFIRGSMIRSEVDGTPGLNDMPGRLIFGTTADGASSPSERMRINAAGNVLIGTTTDTGVDKVQVAGIVAAGLVGASGSFKVYGFTSGSATFSVSGTAGGSSVRGLADAIVFNDLDGTPGDGTSAVANRQFRATTTTGAVSLTVHIGDGTASSNHQLFGKGGHNSLAANNGNLSVGTVTDNTVGKLQVSGAFTVSGTSYFAQTSTDLPGSGNTTVGGSIRSVGTAHFSSATSNSSFNVNADTTLISMRRSGLQVGSISVTTTATAYNTSSDYRLKENIQDLVGSGEFIDKLQPKTWDWISDKSRGVGFIAHELQMISPLSVTGEFDEVDENGEPIYQGVEYGSAEVIAMMVAELKSLRQRVAILESK